MNLCNYLYNVSSIWILKNEDMSLRYHEINKGYIDIYVGVTPSRINLFIDINIGYILTGVYLWTKRYHSTLEYVYIRRDFTITFPRVW
jgi:ADP-dependent phosphofructokinase/glucokinase